MSDLAWKVGDKVYAAEVEQWNGKAEAEVEEATISRVGKEYVFLSGRPGLKFGCSVRFTHIDRHLARTRREAIERVRDQARATLRQAETRIAACDRALAKETEAGR